MLFSLRRFKGSTGSATDRSLSTCLSHRTPLSPVSSTDTLTEPLDSSVPRKLDSPIHSPIPEPATFVEGPVLVALMNILLALHPLLQVIVVPGLQDAASTLSGVIKSFHWTLEAEAGWKQLVLRLERLCFLLRLIRNEPDMTDDIQVLLRPISETLLELSNNLKMLQNSDRSVIGGFFTSRTENGSIYTYEKMIDQLNTSLTHELCQNTNVTARQIRAELNQISEKFEAKFTRSGSFELSDNTAEDVHGLAFSNLKLLKETSRIQIQNNSAVRIGGDAFCHIEIR